MERGIFERAPLIRFAGEMASQWRSYSLGFSFDQAANKPTCLCPRRLSRTSTRHRLQLVATTANDLGRSTKLPRDTAGLRAYSRDDFPERALSSFVNQISGRGDRRFSAASERARRIS